VGPERERTAFPSYRRREAEALEVGDKLLLYTTRGCFRNPTRDRGRVIGVASVAAPACELAEPVRFGEREFPIGLELAIEQLVPRGAGVELAPLIPKLRESLPNARAWSARLRRTLVPVSGRDAATLLRALPSSYGSIDEARSTYPPPAAPPS
jgi:hypothetical protein